MKSCRFRAAAAGVASVALAGALSADAPSMAFDIVAGAATFTPLHSYAVGEVEGDALFFAGVAGMGLHGRMQNGSTIGFPTTVFNEQIHLLDFGAGATTSVTLAHLPDAIREALLVTNAAHVQYGDTLYIYGGYGPTLDGADWTTRATVTAIDLPAVRDAILLADPVPAAAFTVTPATEAQVAGARIVKMADHFALLGGAMFEGDYGKAASATFVEAYSHEIHVFDTASSFITPDETFAGTVSAADPFRRRDMNALPATLPSGGGTAPGFLIAGGVFLNSLTAHEKPMTYALGDPAVVEEQIFTQRMHQYEGPSASFYSGVCDLNRFVLFSGLSSHVWDGANFQPGPGALWLIPWTAEITMIEMDAGAFTTESVLGVMPAPTTNAELILNELIPTNESGQVLLDSMPPAKVLLGRIPGGLRAAGAGSNPGTFASSTVLEVFVTVGAPGDLTGDGLVNATDLGFLLGSWGPGPSRADLNLDGVVGPADLGLLLGSWS